MQNNLKRGDKVVTVGGLHGEVDAIEDTTVYLIVDGQHTFKIRTPSNWSRRIGLNVHKKACGINFPQAFLYVFISNFV